MKHPFLIMMLMFSITGNVSACNNGNGNIIIENNKDNTMTGNKISIKVNSKTFTATLFDNDAAKAFKEMLPMTISMKELNGDEKYYDLPERLPTNASNPGTTKSGDLMLFGSKTLVLFYKTQSTSYSYTRLGKIDDAAGLASALGSGNVNVTFEIYKD